FLSLPSSIPCLIAPSLLSFSFFFHCSRPPRPLPSFPTRRSSDLDPDDAPHGADRIAGLQVAGHRPALARQPEAVVGAGHHGVARSEEHTSELQSRSDLVCRLLLEKKKKKKQTEYEE